jgi:hypothetical protein
VQVDIFYDPLHELLHSTVHPATSDDDKLGWFVGARHTAPHMHQDKKIGMHFMRAGG